MLELKAYTTSAWVFFCLKSKVARCWGCFQKGTCSLDCDSDYSGCCMESEVKRANCCWANHEQTCATETGLSPLAVLSERNHAWRSQNQFCDLLASPQAAGCCRHSSLKTSVPVTFLWGLKGDSDHRENRIVKWNNAFCTTDIISITSF